LFLICISFYRFGGDTSACIVRTVPADEIQCSPSCAVALLDELQTAGFTDECFKTVHHFGAKATIQAYHDYCRAKISNFQNDGTNERVCKRLALIRNAYKAAPFSAPAKPGIFEALAAAARLEIPID
jgi:hypothetical protein